MSTQNILAQFCAIMNDYFPSSATSTPVAIGVSGGADSLALTYCCHVWQKRHAPNVSLLPLIVDHGVRAGSAAEAQQVFEWLVDWGLTPYILTCTGIGLTQAHFRSARYQKLLLACYHHRAMHLLLGHHQDDVLETVWMRKQSGSHWRGLAGISSVRQQWGITLFRPLLRFTKQELREVLKANHRPWIEDPSNDCDAFQRTRARIFFSECTHAQRNTLWCNTLAWVKQRYEESVVLREQSPLTPCAAGFRVSMDAPCFDLPLEQGAWLLSQWLSSIVMTRTPLKTKILQTTWQSLMTQRSSKEAQVVFTLGGCIGIMYREHLYWFREWGRIQVRPYQQYSTSWCWDQRFFFSGDAKRIEATGWQHAHAYEHLVPKDLPFYVARWANAAMPQCAGGSFYYAHNPCPIFYPMYPLHMLSPASR
jgi:tRNA(Ile)-lysidine synthase